jgi:hypothetical protein
MLMNLSMLAAGIAVGIVVSFGLLHSARAKVRLYEAYIHDRMEGRLRETLAAMTRKPQLIITRSSSQGRIAYQCSSCELEFPLSDDLGPKEAVLVLYRAFRKHVEEAHPETSAGSDTSSTPETE